MARLPRSSVRGRILTFFLENLGKVVTREQIQEAARDPMSGKVPENWHQRLSELRTDAGYTILSWRDRPDLKVSEYLMETTARRALASKRVRPTAAVWAKVLARAGNACEWSEGDGTRCRLRQGETDPVGGGTVRLTPDHMTPHSVDPGSDPGDPAKWQALCGRHQVMKKNFWDSSTGKMNYVAIIQAAPVGEKKEIFKLLKKFFGEE